MQKLNDQELEIKIRNLFALNISVNKISKELNVSTSYVNRILFSKESEKKNLLAKCKITGQTFEDYKNTSGALTRHILELYPNYELPSAFKRRNVFNTTGKYWYEEKFFDLIENNNVIKPIKKCQYCEWVTIDLENKSGAFTSHLINEHAISILNHISRFPDDCKLFKTAIQKINKKTDIISNSNKFIVCEICNEKLSSLTNTHLKKHNISLMEYKLKFPGVRYHSNNFIDKTTLILKEANKIAVKKYVSKPELDVVEFLKSNNISLIQSNRKLLAGVEIDILIDDLKLGIEFNGCKYHTELYGKKSRLFHLSKTTLMNNVGYGLIHIFEDEWETKNEIVKNKLLHILHINSNKEKIYGRKCIIKNIDSKTKNEFLEKNHIQGKDDSNLFFGCYYTNKLIAVMTFDNVRKMNNGNVNSSIYELKRYATDINYVCIGTGGKLLNFFIENYNPLHIVSFADRRWTVNPNNNMYTKLGFKLTKTLGCDYTYFSSKFNRIKRFHKFGFGKSALKKRFPDLYDDKKTEWEIMQLAGFDRIWDCGKWKYELQL